MPLLPWGDFAPDINDLSAAVSANILNVVPRADGYGPFPAFTVLTAALPAACRGYFHARATDGSIAVFAGTATRLYKLDNTSFAWTDVSKGGDSYSSLGTGDHWQLAQFNSLVFAVGPNTVPQVFTLGSSSAFADLAGSPPIARYIAVVGRFLVLSGLVSNPFRVQWSGLNFTDIWTSGTNQSDAQDLPDGGIVRGVAGGEYGIIFQDASIRRMIYAPGSPVIFQIERIAQDDGIFAPYSLIRAGDRIFFCSPQGFKLLVPGGLPTPIGKERVDRTFFTDVDTGNLQLMIGASDPRSSRVFWAYKSLAGTAGLFDKVLVYDWALDKWARLAVSGEYLSSLSRPGLTLESLDGISSSLDALTFSLDDVSTASQAQLSAVNADHKVGFFSGTNLEATLESAEQNGGGRRLFVRGFRPLTDAAGCFGSVSARENAQGAASYSPEVAINPQGLIPARVSTRYARGRLRIPAGTVWTFARGIEPDAISEGTR